MFDLDTTKCQIQQWLCHYITHIISISSTEHDNTGAARGGWGTLPLQYTVIEIIEEKEVSVVKTPFIFWSGHFHFLVCSLLVLLSIINYLFVSIPINVI